MKYKRTARTVCVNKSTNMRYERYASHEVDENERLMKDAKSGSRSRFKNFIKMSMLSTLVKQFPNGDYSAQQCS